MLPDGTFAMGGPRSHWVLINFKAYLPSFLAMAAALGVFMGQVQFWAWVTVATAAASSDPHRHPSAAPPAGAAANK